LSLLASLIDNGLSPASGTVPDYERIERAIHYLSANRRAQPSLSDVARHVGLSEFHFQRMFVRWAGISPKRFLQFLTTDHARRLLRESASLLDTAFEVGLSGTSRLHDLFVAVDAVTPGEFKRAGAGLVISYGYHDSPFGECLAGLTHRGLCWLSFVGTSGRGAALAALARCWTEATLVERPGAVGSAITQVFDGSRQRAPLPVLLKGTNFQIKVWESLLRVPVGALTTYQDLARRIDQPRAARAVGAAVARNPIAYVIPCHRVIHASGHFGEYRWGADRKRAMLGWDAIRHEATRSERVPGDDEPPGVNPAERQTDATAE
jgi:AraC family transcriptional regulator of adaptative response/methylated-DNA-[protein]-cysteine methyltransferase